MKTYIIVLGLLVVALVFSGCAMLGLFPSKNTVEVYMQPAATTNAPARIYIDGDFKGTHCKGESWPKYELRCGEHRFKILAEGYMDWEKDLVVLKGKPHRLVALLVQEDQ